MIRQTRLPNVRSPGAPQAMACVVVLALTLPGVAADQQKTLPRIPAGTSFDDKPPKGWSNLILFVEGRLGAGDVEAASGTVHKYTKMFNLVILANVAKNEEEVYHLEKIGIGFSTKINDRNTVITVDSQKELGANLGMIGRPVFAANEEALNDIRLVKRYANCVLFDAPTIMHHDGDHRTMTVRYLVWVSRGSGRISTFVWLMDRNSDAGDYRLVEPTIQMLPPNMREKRIMHVDGDRFNFFGIPAKDAFALVRIPQGRAVQLTPRLKRVAGLATFDDTTFRELLEAISEAATRKSAHAEY